MQLTIMSVEIHCASVIGDEHLLLAYSAAVRICLIYCCFLVDDLDHNVVAVCIGRHLVKLEVCAQEGGRSARLHSGGRRGGVTEAERARLTDRELMARRRHLDPNESGMRRNTKRNAVRHDPPPARRTTNAAHRRSSGGNAGTRAASSHIQLV